MKPEFDVSNKSATEIDNLRVEKIKLLQEAKQAKFEVKQKVLDLSKQIKMLESEKAGYAVALSKAGHNVEQLELEIQYLTSAFWQARNGG